MRLRRRRSVPWGSPLGTTSVPRVVAPSRSGNTVWCSSGEATPHSIDAEGRSSACASLREFAGSAERRSGARRRERACSAARSASMRRSRTSAAEDRASPAMELASNATTRKVGSTTSSMLSFTGHRKT